MNDRIKRVRVAMGLTQQAFADRLQIDRSSVGHIERGSMTPSDRTISDICRVYGVNEIWLRTGEGEMLANRDRPVVEQISAFLADVIADKPGNVRQRLVYALAKLTDDQWDALDKMLDQMIEDMKKAAPD